MHPMHPMHPVHRSIRPRPVVALLLLSLVTLGCGGQDREEAGQAETESTAEVDEQAGSAYGSEMEGASSSEEASEHAVELWERIESYATWPAPPEHDGWQEGTSPHGFVLRYYINGVAQEDPTQDGAVIVKENYSEESDDALLSVTVMEKRAGYDPPTKDWFYVKYSPEGKLLENARGEPLAGLVGKNGAQGCLPCHARAGDGDYLFMND